MSWGELPIKEYLGLPTITTRLTHKDCQNYFWQNPEKSAKLGSKKLSNGGRIKLIKTVLDGIHAFFWSSAFTLPKSIVTTIKSILVFFLWTRDIRSWYNAKVSSNEVCALKSEGSLGLYDLHIWSKCLIKGWHGIFVAKKNSLWVKWVHEVLLRNSSFWGQKFLPMPLGSGEKFWP